MSFFVAIHKDMVTILGNSAKNGGLDWFSRHKCDNKAEEEGIKKLDNIIYGWPLSQVMIWATIHFHTSHPFYLPLLTRFGHTYANVCIFTFTSLRTIPRILVLWHCKTISILHGPSFNSAEGQVGSCLLQMPVFKDAQN